MQYLSKKGTRPSSILVNILHSLGNIFLQALRKKFLGINLLLNLQLPRRACATRVTVLGLSVHLSVCYHVFCHEAQSTSQKERVQHYTGFIMEIFVKSVVFKSYGVKTKSRSQYANWHKLTSTGSAHPVYLEGTRNHNEGCVLTPALV